MTRKDKNGRLRADRGSLWLPGAKNYDWLLEFPEVKEWHDVGLNGPNTKIQYLKGLGRICQILGLKPNELLSKDEIEARRLIEGALAKWLDAGKGATAKQTQLALKSFFRYHDKELKFKRKIQIVRRKITYEIIPNKTQVFDMANSGSIRNRAVILSLFQSGVRVNCFSRWTIGMMREQLFPKDGREMKIPIMLKITPDLDTKLASYGLPFYPAFLQNDAALALRKYLMQREKEEGELRDEDYVFKPEAAQHSNPNLKQVQVLLTVKRAAQRAGLDPKGVWTHCLRKAFRKVLNGAEMDEDTREFLMGHMPPGSRANYFDVHDMDEVAEKYMRCNFDSGVGAGRFTTLEVENENLKERLAYLEWKLGLMFDAIDKGDREDLESIRLARARQFTKKEPSA
jgi:hypothetical protein